GRVGERGELRAPVNRLLCKLRDVAIRGECDDSESICVAREHVERADADGARGTENRNADHDATPISVSPRRSTGAAPVTLSMRSITPPWPGKSLPLSLRPANRLSKLSVRSPITENATTARHSGRKVCTGTSKT